jgi:hypothetical protein
MVMVEVRAVGQTTLAGPDQDKLNPINQIRSIAAIAFAVEYRLRDISGDLQSLGCCFDYQCAARDVDALESRAILASTGIEGGIESAFKRVMRAAGNSSCIGVCTVPPKQDPPRSRGSIACEAQALSVAGLTGSRILDFAAVVCLIAIRPAGQEAEKRLYRSARGILLYPASANEVDAWAGSRTGLLACACGKTCQQDSQASAASHQFFLLLYRSLHRLPHSC